VGNRRVDARRLRIVRGHPKEAREADGTTATPSIMMKKAGHLYRESSANGGRTVERADWEEARYGGHSREEGEPSGIHAGWRRHEVLALPPAGGGSRTRSCGTGRPGTRLICRWQAWTGQGRRSPLPRDLPALCIEDGKTKAGGDDPTCWCAWMHVVGEAGPR
jgi:hypothetical protein